MNKRIAKKVLSDEHRSRRIRLWDLGYGPEHGPWDIERRARSYLNRRKCDAFRKTLKVVRRLEALTKSGAGGEERAEALVEAWAALRPFVWRKVRGGRWEWRRHGWPLAGESVAEGRVVGENEVRRVAERGAPLFEVVVDTLHYFSDRWCVSRVGRMDALVEAVSVAAPR